MIKAVIFDMNGVIVNNEAFHEKIIRKVLERHAIEVTPEEFNKIFVGRTDEDGFRSLVKAKRLKADPKALAIEKQRQESATIRDSFVPVPGSIDAIRILKENFKLALVSSAIRTEIEAVLEKFGIRKLFDVIVSGDDVTNGKPNPEPYLLAATKLDIAPQNCVVIEDAPNGIFSARAAGMKCIGYSTKYATTEAFEKANGVVDDLKQITVAYIRNV